ncbi:secretory phospholipase A2 [Hordeum vulgare]|nr:secretory phospholipase A2 [Hordeum vulgare]
MHAGSLLPLLLLLSAANRSLGRAGIFGAAPPPSSPGDEKCSRTCESAYCMGTIGTYVRPCLPCRRLSAIYLPLSLTPEAPLMRYGKYCGVSYTGCPGEPPCDALDACCMLHDACIQATDDYLNMWCNQSLLDCVAAVRTAAGGDVEAAVLTTFDGNRCNATDVADEITSILEAAVYAGSILRTAPAPGPAP